MYVRVYIIYIYIHVAIQGAQGPPTGGGVVYTRWGSSCPSGQVTELVYLGRAGGSHSSVKGSGKS